MEDIIKMINDSISEYVEGKIDAFELNTKILPFHNTETTEKLVKTGNVVVVMILDQIQELTHYIEYETEDRKKGLNQVIENYYNEFTSGIKPYETKIPFTYSWNSPNFRLDVKYNLS